MKPETKRKPSYGVSPSRKRADPKMVLKLTLKKKWYDMIASGKKLEEYRSPSPWIYSRLMEKDGYTHRKYAMIEFRNGYRPDAPVMTVQYLGWSFGGGFQKWGAEPRTNYIRIKLGRVLSVKRP